MWVIVFTNSWSTVDAFFLFILLPIPRGYLFIRLLPSCRADCWRKRKEKKPRVVIKVAHKIEWATIKFPRSIEPLWALTYSTDNIPFPFRILFFFVSLGECEIERKEGITVANAKGKSWQGKGEVMSSKRERNEMNWKMMDFSYFSRIIIVLTSLEPERSKRASKRTKWWARDIFSFHSPAEYAHKKFLLPAERRENAREKGKDLGNEWKGKKEERITAGKNKMCVTAVNLSFSFRTPSISWLESGS